LPTGSYNDPNFTASTLSNVSNRVLSYVDAAVGKFNGDSTVLPWPPANPAAITITATDSFQPLTTCDLTAPTAPTALTATAVSPTTINLSWTAGTDNVGITNYKVFRDNAPSPIASVVGTTFADTGLAPSTTHSYKVIASDVAGNLSPASNIASATTPADTTPPTAPTNLAGVAPNSTTVNLSWTTSTDNVGVVAYKVFRDGGLTPVATVTGTTATDVGLAVGSSHNYAVTAVDGANNQSAASSTIVVTTQGADLTPPSTPTGLTATGASASVIDLSWMASTDNFGVVGYKVFRDGGATEIATVTTGTSFSDGGLAVGSTHSYTVAAFDAANNQSAKSTSASATTQIAGALTALTINPTTVTAPASSKGTVTLSGAAPTGGIAITLRSSDTRKATVPLTVTVAAGQTSATFTITTLTGNLGGGQNPVTITATLAGTGRTAVLNVLR
jgi:fibronectin type 3 domain-containing protein